jgi:hypothetical protein
MINYTVVYEPTNGWYEVRGSYITSVGNRVTIIDAFGDESDAHAYVAYLENKDNKEWP